MYVMNFKIKVGKWLLQTLESVTITKSVLNLSDTAVIKLPGAYINESKQVEDKIGIGNSVEIWLGYGDELKLEFKGYLNIISTDGNSISLQCEDELYLLRKNLKNEQFASVSVKKLLENVIKQVNDGEGTNYKVVCDYDFSYSKFTIFKATGVDVLKKIQDETKANIYFKGGELHIHPVYSEIGNETAVKYDFTKNIEKSELKYVMAEDKKIEIEVIMTMPDGTQKKQTYGTTGGEKKTVNIGAADASNLKAVAENHYNIWNYNGYEGNFTTWLIPYIEPTFKAEFKDAEYKKKEGVYYVTGAETTFSASGASRKVTLGKRIN
jgi:hypothetical protein